MWVLSQVETTITSVQPKPLFWFRSNTIVCGQILKIFRLFLKICVQFQDLKNLWKIWKFLKKKVLVLEKKFWLWYRYWNWTLVLVPDTVTWFRFLTKRCILHMSRENYIVTVPLGFEFEKWYFVTKNVLTYCEKKLF